MTGGRRFQRRPRLLWTALLVGLVPPLLCGCRGAESVAEPYEPASVATLAGVEVKQVTLTQEAARRVALQTVPTRRSGQHVVVPYASLIYDGQGATWVYATTAPLTFLRASVVVDRIDNDDVLLTRGPAVGVSVVTVGVAEVWGAELDIAGGH